MAGPWEDYAAPKLPRGLRNNNPGNIEDGAFARSIPGYQGSDGRFAVYDSLDNGRAAHAALLGSYGRKGINTVEGVVNRWAPPSENNTGAYVKFVAEKMGVDPRAPLDMNDPQVLSALSDAQAQHENGVAMPASNAPPWMDYGGQPAPSAKPAPASGQPGAPPMPQRPGAVPYPALGPGVTVERVGAPPPADRPTDEWLGFKDRYLKTADKIAQFSPLNMIPGYREGLEASRPKIEASIAQQSQTRKPGMFGSFAGDVAATAWMPGGPVKALAPFVQGGLAGAALSDATDAGGVARDAALGGVTGSVAKYGFDKLGGVVSTALSKAPQIMDLPALQAAKNAAYAAVDNSGFTFPKEKVSALVDDLAKTVRSSALSKSAKDDAASIIQYAKTLAKGDLSLSQLEKLRGDIYEAMVKKGGDTSVIGTKFRQSIDSLIDTADNGLVRTARDLNARWKKADLVNRKSNSADIRAEKDYGGDYGRKMKDRVFPLIDPDNPTRNLRGATPDEKAGLQRIATGTKSQNAASMFGGMLDPRRLGGKILAGITTTGGGAGAGLTGGLSLAIPALQIASGFGLTGYASRVAQKNVDDLIRLIAAGGSKEALKRAPTAASRTAAKVTAATAPLVAAPSVALARPPQKKKPAR